MLDIDGTVLKFSNMGLFSSKDAWIHPERIIDTFEIIYVVEGNFLMKEDDTIYELKPKTFLILHPFHRHCGVMKSDGTVKFYWLHFRCENFEKLNLKKIYSNKVLLAKNNVDDLIFALDYFGCVPNYTRDNGADWCSQPPFLALMIKDIDASIKDAEWLATAILKLENEYKFWMDNRFTKSGLNQYGTNKKTERGLAWYYDHVVCKRIAFTDKLTIKQKAERAKNFIAEAESGEDFTPRYNNHNAMQMNQIDLNSHIFGIEQLLYSYYQGKDEEKYQFYKQQADKRVELLKSLCFDKESNLFYDYNFEEETISKRLCAACFLPYYYKIAENGDGLLKLYGALKSKGGVFACEDVGDNAYQWGYPNIWAPHQYFAFVALKNYGFEKEANELRDNYMNLLEGEFNRTGKIWERYDEDGVAKSLEYETQPMLGWTAGVYNYFWADKHSK